MPFLYPEVSDVGSTDGRCPLGRRPGFGVLVAISIARYFGVTQTGQTTMAAASRPHMLAIKKGFLACPRRVAQ